MLNDELYALLSGCSALTALVGVRIYPVTAPEDYQYSGPYLIYSRVSNQSEESHDGPAGLARARYQFSAYAKARDGGNMRCRQIAEAIRMGLTAYRGGSIQNISHENDLDVFDSETLLHHVPLDLTIVYAEPQP